MLHDHMRSARLSAVVEEQCFLQRLRTLSRHMPGKVHLLQLWKKIKTRTLLSSNSKSYCFSHSGEYFALFKEVLYGLQTAGHDDSLGRGLTGAQRSQWSWSPDTRLPTTNNSTVAQWKPMPSCCRHCPGSESLVCAEVTEP